MNTRLEMAVSAIRAAIKRFETHFFMAVCLKLSVMNTEPEVS